MSFRAKPNRVLKKTIDADESRRKREEATVEIRKMSRQDQFAKRRATKPNEHVAVSPQGSGLDRNQRNQEILEKLRALPQLVQGVMSDDTARQIECVTHFRKLLSIERNPPIQEVIDSGVVHRLVHFLTFAQTPILQFEAAWALTNIASGTSKHTKVVMDFGAVRIFVQLLKSPNEDVREQAVWALGNIAGDSAACRDSVLKQGALEPLLALCEPNAKITMQRNATWTLSNFCRGKPQPPFELVAPALQRLAQLIYSKDDEVLTDACWALSYLSDDTGPQNTKIQAVIQSGVARRLVELLMHKSPNVKTPALRTVGNIVTGDDLQTQVIMNCSVLPCLLALLANPKKGIRKEACWTISNITAGNPDQIAAVIDANIIPPLVEILKQEEFDIQKEAAWGISNATSGGRDDQIRHLVAQGVIKPLCDLFICQDAKIVMVAMEGIENILRVGETDRAQNNGNNVYADFVEECAGLDSLEQLQRHENEEIYMKAAKIIRTYFESEEETEQQNLAPQQQGDGSQFAFGGQPQGQGGFNFQ